jgi:hypothetical protein
MHQNPILKRSFLHGSWSRTPHVSLLSGQNREDEIEEKVRGERVGRMRLWKK